MNCELLIRLKEHIHIVVEGKKYDGSWMRPIHISQAERKRHGDEAIAIVNLLLEEAEKEGR